MGQHSSAEARQLSPEQLSQELAHRFASTCYTELELYCYKGVFRNLADAESDVKYWSEATLCQFLNIPDVLGAGPVIYQMATYLGAFPFPSLAPCILTREAMIKVITLLTDRHKKVLKRGSRDRIKLLFSSLAVFDRRASEVALRFEPEPDEDPAEALSEALKGVSGFSVDQHSPEAAQDEDEEEDENEDQLSLAALENLDTIEVVGMPGQPDVQHLVIPSDNLLRLVELLLLIAPLSAQESVLEYTHQLAKEGTENLRSTANNILAAFDVENQPGIPYKSFKAVIESSLPHLFDPLNPLFEHFLFQDSFELSKRKNSTTSITSLQKPSTITSPTSPPRAFVPTPTPTPTPAPSLIPSGGSLDLLTPALLSQITTFISSPTLHHRLNHLYSGSSHGFSMGSFEKRVFNWHGPTLLLVSGTLLPSSPSNSRERAFSDALPPRRFPSGAQRSSNSTAAQKVTYGVLINLPWRQTTRAPFGDSSTLLFQLAPTHHVFHASSLSTDYVSFLPASPTTPHAGIGLGMKLLASRTTHSTTLVPLGPVSLYLDDALEFGCFTHTAAGGGSFGVSASSVRGKRNRRVSAAAMQARRGEIGGKEKTVMKEGADWQDRFEVEGLEVYGLGGDKEAERQRKAVEFEEREAKRRRELGGTGDVDADRELLKMAGLIGNHDQGGSMG